MPAQLLGARVAYYSEFDEFPALEAFLDDGTLDANGDPNYINLSSANAVRIRIAYKSWSHYYSPRGTIIDGIIQGNCVIDPDQVNNTGRITWTPGAGELTPAGIYEYVFRIYWTATAVQTVPSNTTLPLIIKSNIGGGL